MSAKKLQNYFNDFLPMSYFEFRRGLLQLTANQAVVGELIRLCCEEEDVKAIKIAFERIIGKPEKVIIIKHTTVRMLYPDAKKKALKPSEDAQGNIPAVKTYDDKVVINEENAPGILLKKMLEKVGEKGRDYAYDVVDKKDRHQVAEVMVSNLYAIAMRGGNLAAIDMLFNYLDGAVADVVRLQGEDTIELENYADIAPYEAIKRDDGVFYVDVEAVR